MFVVVVLPLSSSGIAHSDPLGSATLFSAPGAGSSVVEGADGNIWTTNSNGANGVVKMTRSGTATLYNSIPIGNAYQNITSGPDGGMWFADGFDISTISSQGVAANYRVPQSLWASNQGLVDGPDGNVWFAASDGTLARSKIGRITTTGTFLPAYSVGGSPFFLVSDQINSSVWYSLRVLNPGGGYSGQSKIGRSDMNGVQTEFALPQGFGNIMGLTLGPDGNIWFVNGLGKVGKMTPAGIFTFYDFSYSSPDGFLYLTSGTDGYLWATRKNGTVARISTIGTVDTYTVFPTGTSGYSLLGITASRDGNIWLTGKIGTQAQVIKVGTDYSDSDEDGLSDSVESAAYPARDTIFCNTTVTTCEYPNPAIKDIYVENDWMVKPGVDGYSMQLSNDQVSLLRDSFASKGISLHIDTGQLGGGNEVPYNVDLHFVPQVGQVDFYDYKLGGDGISPQMSNLRKDIYHYLITGQNYAEHPNSSGVSYAGDDDVFVSYGLVKDGFGGLPFGTPISGTVMHELGHDLCLSSVAAAYANQPASCRYAGVDADASSSYNSVMSYTKQFTQVDYSRGLNGKPNDHDDWTAIRLGDFTLSDAGDIAHGASVPNPTFRRPLHKRDSRHEHPIIEPSIIKSNVRT